MTTTAAIPYSYYNVLNPKAPLSTAVTANPFAISAPAATPSSSQSTDSGTTPTTGSNSGTATVSTQLISLLQAFSPQNSSSQAFSLLGGGNNFSASILSAAYNKTLSSAYQSLGGQAATLNKDLNLNNILGDSSGVSSLLA